MFTLDGSNVAKPIGLPDLQPGETVTFCSCVHKVKKMSGFAFVLLRTGQMVIQSVYDAQYCKDDLDDLKEGVYIELTGLVRSDERAAYGVELQLTGFRVLSKPEAEYPLHVSHKRLGCPIETNLQYRSVALRNPYERAVFKVAEGIEEGFRRYMLSAGFTQIHSPKIVASGAEGGANIFKLKYFEKDAFLAQSPQFYKQACVAFFDRVFEVAPVYRAEKHNSTRHLNEYIGLDYEMGFIDNMTDVMNVEVAMLQYVIKHLAEHYTDALTVTGAVLPVIDSIPSVTFFEAVDIVGGKNKFDLEPEDENKLCVYAKEKFNSDFIFVTHFPSAKRPFYAMDTPGNPKLAESFDLLFRGLEITTGGQRIHNYNEQIAKMERMGLDPEDFTSYLAIHKYGMPPHGGLGIGLERLTMKLLNLPNIRQASLFPRDITHLDP